MHPARISENFRHTVEFYMYVLIEYWSYAKISANKV